jgi:gliding motility-associated-like protein
MNTNKKLLTLLFLLALCSMGNAQLNTNPYFFRGDSLNGFDLKVCYQDVQDEHFTEAEMVSYLKVQEELFICRKYKIPSKQRKLSPGSYLLTTGCNNIGFESGDSTGWVSYTGYNSNSDSAVTFVANGFSTLGLNSAETSCSMFTIVNAAAGNDPWGAFPMLDPLPIGGTYSLRLGGENANLRSGSPCSGGGGGGGNGAPGESIQQTFLVTAANAMFSYDYAVVLVQAPHTTMQCPYFRAEVLDQNMIPIPCLQYYVESVGTGTPPGMSVSANSWTGKQVYYSSWTSNSLNLKNYINQNVTVRFSAAGCVPGGHWGYAYVDARCGPVQILTTSPTVCLGGTNTLTAPGAGPTGTYSWTTVPPGGTGFVGSTAAQSATVSASGTYEVTVTQGPGCTYTIDTTLTFNPIPVVTLTSTNPSCTPGHDGTATATVTVGTAPYTYVWSPVPPVGQGTPNATGLDAGTYVVNITSVGGCTTQGSVTLTAPLPAPTVSISSTPASCSPGADGTATAVVTGGALPATYTWSGGTITGGQGTLTATGLNAGTFVFTVNGPAGACSATATVTVTQPNGPTASGVATNVSCFGLSDGTATVTGTGGTAPLNYAWSPNTSLINVAAGLAAGTYVCTTSDSKGCSVTTSVTITQPALLSVSANGTNITCHNLCNGGLISVPVGGTATYAYSWSSGCTQASCTNICPGTYTIQVTDAHGCKANDSITITQPPGMVLTLSPVPTHCGKSDGRDSVVVSGGNPGYIYSWSPAGGTQPVAMGITAGNYTVIVHDSHGCSDTSHNTVPNLPGVNIVLDSTRNVSCFGGTNGMASATASGGFHPYVYTWSPGGQTTPKATNLSAGTYVCTVTDSAGCRNTVSATILQPPLLTVATTPSTICLTGCANLTSVGNGGTPVYNYAWTLNGTPSPVHVCPTASTTYTVICTDAHGCASTAPLTISVNPALEVIASGAKKICPGSSTVLNAIGSGGNGGPYTYLWAPPTGLSSTTVANPTASPTVTTTYTVIVSDNCGTPTDSDQVTVTVYPLPVVNFTAKDTVVCGPDCVVFTGTSVPACSTAVWNFGDGTSGSGCTTASHCYPTAGNYTITYTVTDVDGCPGTHSINQFFNVLQKPVAAFTDSPQPTTMLDSVIYFTDQSIGSIASWSWNFGDLAGATSLLQNPHYGYPDTGCYPVTLIIVATNGCKDEVEHPVCIQPYFTFYAPNTFTPNGDGKNDVWMPYGVGIDPNNYHLMMFDRWGNLMFETYAWDQGWDGRANNGVNIAQIDTYVWKVDLKDVFHNKHQYIGHCNIIK